MEKENKQLEEFLESPAIISPTIREVEKEETLLNERNEESLVEGESLLGGEQETMIDSDILDSDTSTPTVDVNDILRKKKFEEEQAARIAYFKDPENQAEIVLQNYLMNHKDFYPTGHQKRMLKRQFIREAKKGRYKRLFADQLKEWTYEEVSQNFKTLNA